MRFARIEPGFGILKRPGQLEAFDGFAQLGAPLLRIRFGGLGFIPDGTQPVHKLPELFAEDLLAVLAGATPLVLMAKRKWPRLATAGNMTVENSG